MKKTKVEKFYQNSDIMLTKKANIDKLRQKYKNIYVDDIENNKHFAFILSMSTAQQKGPRYQNRFAKLLHGSVVDSKLDRGDIKVSINDKESYVEVKTSTPSADGNVLNLVQIRLYQDINYYLCAFVDDINYKENYVFFLTKDQMKQEIKTMRATNAHIAKTSISNNPNVEKRLTIDLNNLNNKDTIRWLNNYRSKELEDILLKEGETIMQNEKELIEKIKDEFPDEEQNQHEEISREYFLELCDQYNVKPTDELVDKIIEETGISVDYTVFEHEVSILEKKISALLKKYDSAQKQYHGDSSLSKSIESEIDNLECQLNKLTDQKSQAYKAGWNYLRKLARENGWKEYEITEDSYKYNDGLLLIGYEDKQHTQEIDHVTINVLDFIKKQKKSK